MSNKVRKQIDREIRPLALLIEVDVWWDRQLFYAKRKNASFETAIACKPRSVEGVKQFLRQHFVCPKNPSHR